LPAGFYNKPINWQIEDGESPSAELQAAIKSAAGQAANRHEIGGVDKWSMQMNVPGGRSVRFVHLGVMGVAKVGAAPVGESPSVGSVVASWGTEDLADDWYRMSFGTDHGPGSGGSTSPLHFEIYTPDLVDVDGGAAVADYRYFDFCIAGPTADDTVTWSWSVVALDGATPTQWLDTDADLTGCPYAMLELDWILSIASVAQDTPAATFEITASISGPSINASVFTSMHIGGGVTL